MADTGAPIWPSILVSAEGAPAGCVYVHCERSGRTVLAPRDDYLPAVRGLNHDRP